MYQRAGKFAIYRNQRSLWWSLIPHLLRGCNVDIFSCDRDTGLPFADHPRKPSAYHRRAVTPIVDMDVNRRSDFNWRYGHLHLRTKIKKLNINFDQEALAALSRSALRCRGGSE